MALFSFFGTKLWAGNTVFVDNLYFECSGSATVVGTAYSNDEIIDKIVIPATVLYANSSVTVNYIASDAFKDLRGLKEVVLPESWMLTVRKNAFANCSSLQAITIPVSNSAFTFEGDAFAGCNSVRRVICNSNNPANISDNTFSDDTYNNAILYVPKTAIYDYKSDRGWKRFKTIHYIGQDPESISLPQSLEMKVGNTHTLQPTISPSTAEPSELTWISSNPSIVSVDADGVITAKAGGVARVTVTTFNGYSATCEVSVIQPVESLAIAEVGDIHVGDSRKLKVTISPSNATDKTITFSSSNPGVVSVSEDGTVTGISLGSATITARATSGVSASIVINVVPIPVTSISLPSSTTIYVGESSTLEATINPSDATYKDLTWMSSNPGVVRVDATGKITGVSEGKADITATAHNGVKAVTNVSVIPVEVTSIELSESNLHLGVGKSATLIADVKPENATDRTVTWKSSNEEVASVNNAGRVTAIGEGTATITATTSNGLTASCLVVVDIPVTSLTIDYEAMGIEDGAAQLKVNDQLQIKVIVNPEDATDKTLTFSSTDPSKASVSSDGLVTAHSLGNVTITVSASSGVKTIMEVRVIPTPAESITLNVDETELEVGDKLNLVAVILPSSTTDKSIIWKSSIPAVASVSEEGVVEALSIGETDITAMASNGVKASAKITVVPTPANYITVVPVTLNLNVGDVATVWAEVLPENTTNKGVKWSSSDDKVASVDQRGDVKALSEGLAMITAMTLDGTYLSASCQVVVNDISGIEEITVEEAMGEIFTLSGLKVEAVHNLLPGIYILRKDNIVKKVRIK
ncbi:MAG: Ig-like domain-containing protein [Muribaculaceae bacterium]|nr:Ig-like domain-containing protein [Muribaculaceae bacterium]